MDSRIYMRTALNSSCVYDTENRNINAELSAYEAGLNMFMADMEKVVNNFFIETADKDNLISRMKLFRSYISEGESEVLRAELAEKAKLRTASLADIQHRLAAIGIEGKVSEEKLKAKVAVTKLNGIEPEAAEAEMKKYLPVFIELTVTEI